MSTAHSDDGTRGVMITRAALHQIVAAAAVEAGVEMHYGKRLVEVEDVPGKPVVVRFEDGSTAEGDILIGADGIRSQVRQCVLPAARSRSIRGCSPAGSVHAMWM